MGKILGAKFTLSVTLPIANNSLSSDATGALAGGGGFADSYYQPFILGWQTKRADIRAIYGFLAPIGMIGYGQWQTTDKTGITPTQATAHYRVNALGFGSHLTSPARKVTLGFKYFREFSSRSTFQGYSAQISASISF